MAYVTRRFNVAFTRALQLSLSPAESIQFLVLIPISSRSILTLSSHLRLGLPKGAYCTYLDIFKQILVHKSLSYKTQIE